MHPPEWLAEQFEQNRGHLRAVAYRMLGSTTEADDAVQEAWLKLSRTDSSSIENMGAWLTTVLARVCLDMLRARSSRREDSLEAGAFEPISGGSPASNPEREALLADSIGLAVMVVLDKLAPAERLAFVLHDMFGVSFDEIAKIVRKSPEAARQLASRARRRVQGTDVASAANISKQRKVVDAFLTALRTGDYQGLLTVLDPDVVVRIDKFAAAQPGQAREIHGAENWARGAVAFSHMAESIEPMLVDGAIGLIWAPQGKLQRALRFTIVNDRISEAEIIGDPERLGNLDLALVRDDD
jgi:RNA polymerase sigma factor (sigma-70 family)